jgi:hypothetical protein
MVYGTTQVFQNEQHGKAWQASGKTWVVPNTMLFYTVFFVHLSWYFTPYSHHPPFSTRTTW